MQLVGIVVESLETLLLHRRHCVVSSGVGEPDQVNPSFIVSGKPTEAVPETVKVPVAEGDEPTAVVAKENSLSAAIVLVAVTRMRI